MLILAAIVLDNYLYIDGGEITYYDNGEPVHVPGSSRRKYAVFTSSADSLADNNTYSIDLSTSWTNLTVTLNQIPKTAPVLNYVALWADSTNSSFYAWGGEVSRSLPPDQGPPVPQNAVWKFTPSSEGSGSWSEQSMSSNSIFPSLTRSAGAIGAYGNGTGYLLGGYETASTRPQNADLQGFLPTPGIVSYDIEAGAWKNESAAGYSAYGTAMYGQMQFVPLAGNDGLLVVLGGGTSDAVEWTDRGANYISFQEINIYHPATSTWHKQTASGPTPNARARFCSVAAQGDNGTYEIFIYGGHVASPSGEPQASNTEAQRERNTALDEVFVLSLPGFVWTKANYTAATPRVNHACSAAANRQMIVTGGLNPASANQSELINSRDIWTQGIGVFDLTAMQWKDNYDTNAQPYMTPDAVKSWYAANGPYPSVWDDPAVEDFFTQSSIDPSNGGANLGGASPEDGSGSSKPNAGAIAGGVVGGVAGLALLATSFWFLRRSRRRPSHPRPNSTGSKEETLEAQGDSTYHSQGSSSIHGNMETKAELGVSNPPPTYSNKFKPLPELEQPQALPAEVSGSPPRHEMP
jgi:Kelch motif